MTGLFDYHDNFQNAEPEHEARITVAELLSHIDVPDDWDVGFGSTTDASWLELKAISQVVAFDLVQPRIPEWRPAGE